MIEISDRSIDIKYGYRVFKKSIDAKNIDYFNKIIPVYILFLKQQSLVVSI